MAEDPREHTARETHHHHTHHHPAAHTGGHHLLQVEGLSIGFDRYVEGAGFSAQRELLSVVHDLSLSVHAGEIMAVVGASGSGKTLLAEALLGLYEPNVRVEGSIFFDGARQDAASLAQLRGREIAFVPQAVTALDPRMRVGRQIGGSAEERATLYERYRLDPAVERLFPFELSGGMARRVLLLTALISNPKLIVADEPTPGLDLELALQAMDDFKQFATEGGGVLLITHDIELALRVANRVAVFRDGTIVEEADVERFAAPELLENSFSQRLWHALPEHDFVDVGCRMEPVNSVAEVSQ